MARETPEQLTAHWRLQAPAPPARLHGPQRPLSGAADRLLARALDPLSSPASADSQLHSWPRGVQALVGVSARSGSGWQKPWHAHGGCSHTRPPLHGHLYPWLAFASRSPALSPQAHWSGECEGLLHTHTHSRHTDTHTHQVHRHTHTPGSLTHTHTHSRLTYTHRAGSHTHTHTQRAHTHTPSTHTPGTHTHTHTRLTHTHQAHTHTPGTHTHQAHTDTRHTPTPTPGTHTNTCTPGTHRHKGTQTQAQRHTHRHTGAHTHTRATSAQRQGRAGRGSSWVRGAQATPGPRGQRV